MLTLCLFVSCIPFVALSLFDYTQDECDLINIYGVYTGDDTILIDARNERTENMYSERACMPYPQWKIYDTRNTKQIKFYGEQDPESASNPECLLDRTYEVPKDSQSISSITSGDYVSLRLELWVNKSQELACQYEWDGLLHEQNICEQYIDINNIYLSDGDRTADTINLNISMKFNQYSCSYFAYPTFKLYNNANNKLWGKMDRAAQTYCLVQGEYPIINNGTTDDGFQPGQEVSMTIELWKNWRDFACSFEWNGIINYTRSIEFVQTLSPSISRSEMGETLAPSLASTNEMDPQTRPTEADGNIVYHIIAIVVSFLTTVIIVF